MASEKYELMHQALSLVETAKDAMQAGNPAVPDETSRALAENILKRARQLMPGNAIVRELNLGPEPSWASVRSALQAVVNACESDSKAPPVPSAPGFGGRPR